MRILIATDGSKFSEAAIDKACELLSLTGAAIRIVTVVEPPTPVMTESGFIPSDYYERVGKELQEAALESVTQAEARVRKNLDGNKLDISTDVLDGFADQVIIEEAANWNADLIVVGSHGRGFWGRLLGSVSNGVVHHAPCAVLVVRTTT